MAMAAAEKGCLDCDSMMFALQSHARLAFQNERFVDRMEAELLSMLKQSRATAACLSASLLSLSQLQSTSSALRRELIDGAARVATEHMAFFRANELCELLEAMGIFRLRDQSELLLGIGKSLSRQANELSPKDCSIAAKSFAVCRVHDEKILTALAGRLRDKEVRAALSPEELRDILYGFAKFTSQDIALLDLLSIEVRRHLHLLNVPLLSSMLSSLAKAGVTCPVLTGRATQILRRSEEGAHSSLSKASFQELSALTMAFAKLQVRDLRLHERLAEACLECEAIEVASTSDLVNVVHAFTKVHMSPIKLFGTIMRLMHSRPREELQTRDVVKLLHALAKVEYVILPQTKEHLLSALKDLEDLGVFELLKLSVAARKLGIELPAVESQMVAILPNEPPLRETPQRRPVAKKQRKKSARKQKWTW